MRVVTSLAVAAFLAATAVPAYGQGTPEEEMAKSLGSDGELRAVAGNCPTGPGETDCLVNVFTADASVTRRVLLYLLSRKVQGAKEGLNKEDLAKLLREILADPTKRQEVFGDLLDDRSLRAHVAVALGGFFSPNGAAPFLEGGVVVDRGARAAGQVDFQIRALGVIGFTDGIFVGGRGDLSVGLALSDDIIVSVPVGFHVLGKPGPKGITKTHDYDWATVQLEVGGRFRGWRYLEATVLLAVGPNDTRGAQEVRTVVSGLATVGLRWP